MYKEDAPYRRTVSAIRLSPVVELGGGEDDFLGFLDLSPKTLATGILLDLGVPLAKILRCNGTSWQITKNFGSERQRAYLIQNGVHIYVYAIFCA